MSINPMVVKAITFWGRFVLKAKRACSIASLARLNSSKPYSALPSPLISLGLMSTAGMKAA